MQEETQKQQILVPYDFSKASENSIVYAIELAALFKCEITILHAINKKNIKLYENEAEAEKTVKNKLVTIANDIIATHNILVNVYVFRDEVDHVINKIYQRINAIAVIAGLNSTKNKHNYFSSGSIVSDYRNLRIPIIVVHDVMARRSIFCGIILPIDFNRESKEKSAWAGHISTLNKTKVTILTRHYKDSYFAASLRSNIVLVKKLFKNLEVDYQLIKEPDIKCDIDKYAIDYAWFNKGDLIVIMATKEIAIDDLLFGLKEKKIIDNKYKLPIMLINPRDDIYLPCGC